MANAVQLAFDVSDLDGATSFYRGLLGVAPASERPGYVTFELADPPLVVSLQQSACDRLSHAGIRVGAPDEVELAAARVTETGFRARHEDDVSCCYSRRDEAWTSDPAGTRWHVYAVGEQLDEEGREPFGGAYAPLRWQPHCPPPRGV